MVVVCLDNGFLRRNRLFLLLSMVEEEGTPLLLLLDLVRLVPPLKDFMLRMVETLLTLPVVVVPAELLGVDGDSGLVVLLMLMFDGL